MHTRPILPRKDKLTTHSFFFFNNQPEFAHPHEVLHNKVELTIASPKGGKAPLDPNSVKMFESDPVSQTFLKEQTALWENTHKLSDVLPRAGEFDAIFYVGGHGRTYNPPLAYATYPLNINFPIYLRKLRTVGRKY